MRVDKTTLVFLLGLASGALSGCDDGSQHGATGDWRVCVDDQGRRVEEIQCQNLDANPQHAHYVFIARGGGVPAIGGFAREGSIQPSRADAEVFSAPEGGVARGGFGGTGEGSIGGGGEGGE